MATSMALVIKNVNRIIMFSSKYNLFTLHKPYRNLRLISSTKSCGRMFRHIDEVIPKNALKDFQNNALQKENGNIYDSRPFKLLLQKDKLYAWCLCGESKSQPLCDRTHSIAELNIKLRPIFFKVEETKEYWLCNCKQTEHRPFCDGSHIPIQEKEKKKEEERAQRVAKT